MQSCRASITGRSVVERGRDWRSNRPWMLRCTIRPSTIMTGVPAQLYSGSSLFATSRVYGRFDEDLGISSKLSPDSNLQTLLQETAHNSIMNMSFAHALTLPVCATEHRKTCLNLPLMRRRYYHQRKPLRQTAENRDRLGLRLRRNQD